MTNEAPPTPAVKPYTRLKLYIIVFTLVGSGAITAIAGSEWNLKLPYFFGAILFFSGWLIYMVTLVKGWIRSAKEGKWTKRFSKGE